MIRAFCKCGGRVAFVAQYETWVCHACGYKGPPCRYTEVIAQTYKELYVQPLWRRLLDRIRQCFTG